ncbi:MAG TPA: hypothetical protein VJT13_00905 [Xanthobacteraceae bacterium]|nr:hypothetical protein [Xanthobacteraceae bacterium]
MSPRDNNNNNGGNFGRAASGTAHRCDAARADNMRDLVRGCAVMACAVTVLVLNAPDLWPQLFLR